MTFQNKRLVGIMLAVALLLLVPVIAKFPWSPIDFITAGVLLLGTGLLCELVLRKVRKIEYRIAICGLFWSHSSLFGQNLQLASSVLRSPEVRGEPFTDLFVTNAQKQKGLDIADAFSLTISDAPISRQILLKEAKRPFPG